MTTRLGLRGAALMLLAGGALAAAPEALAVRAGEPAPAFTLATSRGGAIDLAALKGKVVYVDFWASWCTPCRRSFPWMNALHARYGSEGLAIVGINVDKRRADADRFLADVPAAFAIVFDPAGATPAAFDVKGMPSSYLIDRKGVVVAVEDGYHDDRQAVIEARIRALLEQRQVP